MLFRGVILIESRVFVKASIWKTVLEDREEIKIILDGAEWNKTTINLKTCKTIKMSKEIMDDGHKVIYIYIYTHKHTVPS